MMASSRPQPMWSNALLGEAVQHAEHVNLQQREKQRRQGQGGMGPEPAPGQPEWAAVTAHAPAVTTTTPNKSTRTHTRESKRLLLHWRVEPQGTRTVPLGTCVAGSPTRVSASKELRLGTPGRSKPQYPAQDTHCFSAGGKPNITRGAPGKTGHFQGLRRYRI